MMPQKRSLDTFFSPIAGKKSRQEVTLPVPGEVAFDSAVERTHAQLFTDSKSALPVCEKNEAASSALPASTHHTYPFPVPHLPPSVGPSLFESVPVHPGRPLCHLPALDLLYFQPFIPESTALALFKFLRANLFFYRVKYKIKRGTVETDINTPRFTTVFGVDETSCFSPAGELIDVRSQRPAEQGRYKTCRPRPLPKCLDDLRTLTEAFTDESFNFCLVNYYANGNDSISYHSDDEKFLGPNPAIASFSLGACRDFLMKHKPLPPPAPAAAAQQLKLNLGSGDMVLMRGSTQANWLHSIPKRKGKEADRGRINITFRKAVVRGGTENYYRYNVGEGGIWKWNQEGGEMRECKEGG